MVYTRCLRPKTLQFRPLSCVGTGIHRPKTHPFTGSTLLPIIFASYGCNFHLHDAPQRPQATHQPTIDGTHHKATPTETERLTGISNAVQIPPTLRPVALEPPRIRAILLQTEGSSLQTVQQIPVWPAQSGTRKTNINTSTNGTLSHARRKRTLPIQMTLT